MEEIVSEHFQLLLRFGRGGVIDSFCFEYKVREYG